jgi:hypothetical protein
VCIEVGVTNELGLDDFVLVVVLVEVFDEVGLNVGKTKLISNALAPPCTIGTSSAESDDDNPSKKATNVMIRITGTLPIKEYLIIFHFFIVIN